MAQKGRPIAGVALEDGVIVPGKDVPVPLVAHRLVDAVQLKFVAPTSSPAGPIIAGVVVALIRNAAQYIPGVKDALIVSVNVVLDPITRPSTFTDVTSVPAAL